MLRHLAATSVVLEQARVGGGAQPASNVVQSSPWPAMPGPALLFPSSSAFRNVAQRGHDKKKHGRNQRRQNSMNYS